MGVRVVNKATGELIELEYDSFEDFAMQYDEVTQQIAALAPRAVYTPNPNTHAARARANARGDLAAIFLHLLADFSAPTRRILGWLGARSLMVY
jgi:hypothetical protein